MKEFDEIFRSPQWKQTQPSSGIGYVWGASLVITASFLAGGAFG